MLTFKQTKIIEFAKANGGKIKTANAVELIGYNYFHNKNKHTGEVLARLVKIGRLIREKPGHFIINEKYRPGQKSQEPDENQLNFFTDNG